MTTPFQRPPKVLLLFEESSHDLVASGVSDGGARGRDAHLAS